MKKKLPRLLGALLLVAPLVGCADTPEVVVHDQLVFWNEVGDNQLRAVDNDTAKQLLDVQFKALKEKYDTIKDRVEKKKYNNVGKKEKELRLEIRNALLDYDSEAQATGKRLWNIRLRLEAIIQTIKDPAQRKDLEQVRDWPKGFCQGPAVTGQARKTIKDYSLPRWGDGLTIDYPLDMLKPSQPPAGGQWRPGPKDQLLLDPMLGWAVAPPPRCHDPAMFLALSWAKDL